jgi:hypothetical protein
MASDVQPPGGSLLSPLGFTLWLPARFKNGPKSVDFLKTTFGSPRAISRALRSQNPHFLLVFLGSKGPAKEQIRHLAGAQLGPPTGLDHLGRLLKLLIGNTKVFSREPSWFSTPPGIRGTRLALPGWRSISSVSQPGGPSLFYSLFIKAVTMKEMGPGPLESCEFQGPNRAGEVKVTCASSEGEIGGLRRRNPSGSRLYATWAGPPGIRLERLLREGRCRR